VVEPLQEDLSASAAHETVGIYSAVCNNSFNPGQVNREAGMWASGFVNHQRNACSQRNALTDINICINIVYMSMFHSCKCCNLDISLPLSYIASAEIMTPRLSII